MSLVLCCLYAVLLYGNINFFLQLSNEYSMVSDDKYNIEIEKY